MSSKNPEFNFQKRMKETLLLPLDELRRLSGWNTNAQPTASNTLDALIAKATVRAMETNDYAPLEALKKLFGDMDSSGPAVG